MERRHLLAGVLQGPSRRLSGYRSLVCCECIKRIRDAHSKTKRQSRSFFLYALYQIYDLWRLPRRPIAPSHGRPGERSRFFSSISPSHQAFNRSAFSTHQRRQSRVPGREENSRSVPRKVTPRVSGYHPS